MKHSLMTSLTKPSNVEGSVSTAYLQRTPVIILPVPAGNNALLDNNSTNPVYAKGGPVFVDGRYWRTADGRPISFSRHYTWRNGKGYTIYGRDGKAYKYNNSGKLIDTVDGTIIITSKSLPARQRRNTSTTAAKSERLEDMMYEKIRKHAYNNNHISNSNYNIPYIPSKAILIDGNYVSTNQLDSLAKYWAMHNANPLLSQYPQKGTTATRRLNKNEMLGLARQETFFGANPFYNTSEVDKMKPPYTATDLMNANYLKNYGAIPAEYYVRDFHYNKKRIDLSIPPLLDAFRYYAQGDYNRGDKNHTADVNLQGQDMWKHPAIQQWYNSSGKHWANEGYRLGSKSQ